MNEETAKQFVERMAHLVRITFQEEGIRWEFQRLCNLALRGAETQEEDGTPKTMQQNGMKIAAEQIPFPVQKALRKTLLDGETDERRAIAAALNAWPGVELVEPFTPTPGRGPALRIPLAIKEPRT